MTTQITHNLPPLVTARLRLRPLGLGDAADVFRAIDESRAQFVRWFDWAPGSTLHSAEDNLRRAEEAMALGTACHYGLFLPSGDFLGRVSLEGVTESGEAELGYWLGERHQGCGYMTEAVRALLGHAFASGLVRVVRALARPDNTASQRVLSKAGFSPDPTASAHPTHLTFRLLQEEYRGVEVIPPKNTPRSDRIGSGYNPIDGG